MTKSLVFVMAAAPHASSVAREGLDAILAASAVSEGISVIFEGEGVLQLIPQQQPQAILQRHVAPTYGMLELYDVEAVYVSQAALTQYGLNLAELCIEAQILPLAQQQAICQQAHSILRF